MPELKKTYQLKITVEQFLNACSKNEIKEIDLILGTYLNSSVNKKDVFNFEERLEYLLFPGEILEARNKLKMIPLWHQKAFIGFLGMGYTLGSAFEALEIVNEIEVCSSVPADEVIELMKYFSKLEKVRLKSLVNKPQMLALNPENPMNSDKSEVG